VTALAMPYEELWAAHEPAARRLALSLVPPHAAEDVVSEAFTRVLRAAENGGGPRGEFRPYLLAAVRNTASSWRMRARRAVPVADPDPGPVAGPEHAVLGREDARLAARAYSSLPQRWRWVLWSTAVEEKTPAELSGACGLSPNSVSQLASRAREGLRQAYLNEHLGSRLAPACREVAPYMGASVRGKAGRRHQAELGAHLRSCERCAQAYAGLGRLNSHLGELLVPGGAAIPLALSRLIPKPGLRWLHLAPAAAVAAVAVGGLATVTTVVTAPPGHAATRPAAAAPAASPGPSYVPKHAKPGPPGGGAQAPHQDAQEASAAGPVSSAASGSGAGLARGAAAAPGTAPSPSGQAVPGAVPVISAAGSTVGAVGQAAGSAVSSAGQAAGTTVTAVGQAVAGAVPVPAVSAAAGQVSQAAGGTVTGVTGTAGQAAGSLTGTVGQVAGGL
jgi:RNA polymerase sigma factor (sigma-70 family)